MKKSELKLTGETYRLTPANWGETNIMVDENAVSEMMAESFDITIEECDPDGDPNNKPETVDIATDADDIFYAILHPFEATSWGHKTGGMHNKNLYRECENPANAQNGAASIYGRWETFEDEG